MRKKTLIVKLAVLLAVSAVGLALFAACKDKGGGEPGPTEDGRYISEFMIPEEITAGKGSKFVLPSYFAFDNFGMKHYAQAQVFDRAGLEVAVEDNVLEVTQDVGSRYSVLYTVSLNRFSEMREMRILVREDSAPPTLAVPKSSLVLVEKSRFNIADYYRAADDSGVQPLVKFSAKKDGQALAGFDGKPFELEAGIYEFTFHAEDYSGHVSETKALHVTARASNVIADFELEGDVDKGITYGVDVLGSDPLSITDKLALSGEHSLLYSNRTKNASDFELLVTNIGGYTNGAYVTDSYAIIGFYIYYLPKDDSGYLTLTYDSTKYSPEYHWENAVGNMSFYDDGQLIASGIANGRSKVRVPTEKWVYVEFVVLEYYNCGVILRPEGYKDFRFTAYVDDIKLATESNLKNSVIERSVYGETDPVFDVKEELAVKLRDYSTRESWKPPVFEVVRLEKGKELPVEVTGDKFPIEGGVYHIYYVNGDGLRSGAYTVLNVEDTLFTAVEFDADPRIAANVAVGVAGREYRLIAARSKENGVTVSRQVLFNGQPQEETAGGFTPSQPGGYIVRYTAVKGGRSEDLDIPVKVLAAAEYTQLTADFADLEIPDKIFCGEGVELPEPAYTGGYGEITLSILLQQGGGEERFVPLDGSLLLLETKGDYRLRYVIRDAVGEISQDFAITAEYSPKPVFSGLQIYPNALISGSTYDLNPISAYLYSDSGKSPQPVSVSWVYEGKENPITDWSFTPVTLRHNDTVVIRYASGGSVLESRPLMVIQPVTEEGVDIVKYFTANGVRLNAEEDGLLLTSESGGGQAEFINTLIANGFDAVFSVPAGKSLNEAIVFSLTDSEDAAIRVQFVFTKTGEKTATLGVNNRSPLTFAGSLVGSTVDRFEISYSNYTFVVKDRDGSIVTAVTDTMNGGAFYGFPSQKVRLQIGFAAEGSQLKLYSLNRQVMKNVEADSVGPQIDLSSIDLTVTLGDTVKIPRVTVADVLDPNAKALITVFAPSHTADNPKYAKYNGADIVGLKAAEQSFQAEEIGNYVLRFEFGDWNGNPRSYTVRIYVVEKEKPSITVNGDVPGSAALNSEVTLPSASARDEQSGELTVYVYVCDPNGLFFAAKDNRFTPTKKGTYVIRYYAFDQSYNYDIAEYRLTVE